MQQALEDFFVAGIDTTIPFLRYLTQRLQYVKGDVNTRWLEELLQRSPFQPAQDESAHA